MRDYETDDKLDQAFTEFMADRGASIVAAVVPASVMATRIGTRRLRPAARSFSPGLLVALLGGLLTALLVAGIAVIGSQLLSSRPAQLIPADRGVFTATGSMAVAHEGPTATLLADGRVLVAGGYGGVTDSPGSYPSGTDFLASVEIWDPATGTFSPGGSLITARQGHTATLLRDGRVLILGGGDGKDGALAEVEIWDPATMTSSATGSLLAARFGATATLLADGRVLVFGGTKGAPPDVPVTSAEIWDPISGSFTPADSPAEASYPAGTLLADGRVLVIDGADTSATVWDPTTRSSIAAGSLASVTEARADLITTLLQDGRVLVAGGYAGQMILRSVASAEIWDPGTLTFDATGSMTRARAPGAVAMLLRDGRVLIVGDSLGGDGSSAEVFELK
jgi:hypothetical protein